MSVVATSLGEQLVVVAVSAALALSVGSLVAYLWDDLRRRREGDLATVEGFYRTYGEFFATWKLWEAHMGGEAPAEGSSTSASVQAPLRAETLAAPADVQWRLLERAAAAEAGFEAVLVTLASERKLADRDIKLLGCFREAYQMLRERIRENERLTWRASPIPDEDAVGFKQYLWFKSLAEYVVVTLADSPGPWPPMGWLWPMRRRTTPDEAARSLRAITWRRAFKGRWWTIAEEELGGTSAPSG